MRTRMTGWTVTALLLAVSVCGRNTVAHSQETAASTPRSLTVQTAGVVYGPYNGSFLQGGLGLTHSLHEHEALASAQADWSMSLWLKTDERDLTSLIAGVGRPDESTPRYLGLERGRPVFWAGGAGDGHELAGSAALQPGVWHSLAVSVGADGMTHLFADGAEVASGTVALGPAAAVMEMAPTVAPNWREARHFGGLLAQVGLRAVALQTDSLRAMSVVPLGLDTLPFEEG